MPKRARKPSRDATPPPPTAAIADACLRLGEPLRIAPAGLHPVADGMRVSGPALPARHYGSVDVFLQALETARHGDVLVIENDGRTDEGCIGDLTVLEAAEAGVAGVLVWGLHRDTKELRRIGLPVFTYGHVPTGPTALRPRPENALASARFGPFEVARGDLVVADADGAIFVAAAKANDVVREARTIVEREKAQAAKVRSGISLRSQFEFKAYLEARAKNPRLTFREHLRSLRGEIEQ